MKQEKPLKGKRLHVRFTEQEYTMLLERSQQTTCSNLSEYARKLLLQKPVKVLQRNQSLDELMPLLVALKNELNAIANNYNQVVRRLHVLQHNPELKAWLPQHELAIRIMAAKTTEIKSLIAQISAVWLQS